MAATTSQPKVPLPLPRPVRWHRLLIALAALMALLTAATIVLAIVDPREVLGQNVWFKPLKFAASIAFYSVTLAWLIGLLQRFNRIGRWAGNIVAIALVIEMVIITWAAATQTTSHFNVSTPLNSALWDVMAASIVVVWLMTFVVAIALWLNRMPDRARNTTVRSAVALGLIGMALAFLMTLPQSYQLNDFEGVVGAHAVGVRDGGPGLPLVGWSTEGGDLRIPHFVGMHALQVLPLTLLGLELAGRKVAALRDVRIRHRLIVVFILAFTAFLTILTWQALIGQSIIAPSGPVLAASIGNVFLAGVAVAVVLVRHRSMIPR